MDILKRFLLFAFRPGYSFKNNTKLLNWGWAIFLSWPCELLSVFYLIVIARMTGNLDIIEQNNLMVGLLAAVLFPIIIFIKLVINKFCAILVLRVLGAEPIAYDNISGLLGTALSSKIFLIIPGFGQILTLISYILIMVKGGKYELHLTVGGSILILFATVLVLLTLIFIAFLLGLIICPLVANFA